MKIIEGKKTYSKKDLGEQEIDREIAVFYKQTHIWQDSYLRNEGKEIAIAKLLKKKNLIRKKYKRKIDSALLQEIEGLREAIRREKADKKDTLQRIAKREAQHIRYLTEKQEKKDWGYQRMTDLSACRHQALLDALGKSKHSPISLFPTHAIREGYGDRLILEDRIKKPRENIGKEPKPKERVKIDQVLQDFQGQLIRPKQILEYYGYKKSGKMREWVSAFLKAHFQKIDSHYRVAPKGEAKIEMTQRQKDIIVFDGVRYQRERQRIREEKLVTVPIVTQ